jgi:predicted anti-sigma-YlaC factor YlaD
VQQQEFSGRWVPQNGNVEVEDAKWVNHSNATIQSATLMCVQYASTGTIIFQTTMVLNGPTATGATSTFPSFPMGAIQQAMAKVQCGFVAVTPAQ